MSDEVRDRESGESGEQQLLTKIRNWRLKKNRSRNQLQK